MNNKITYFILALCLLSASPLDGQNLVPNGGFEPACEGHAYMLPLSTYIKPWFSPYGRGIFVDYYGRAQRGDSVATFEKKQGQTFLILDTYRGETLQSEKFSCRGYAISPLVRPLVKGRDYYFEIKVHIHKKYSDVLIGNFGALFSMLPPRPDSCASILDTPQVVNPGIIPLDNDWHPVSGIFTATEAYRYLTVGVFLTDSALSSVIVDNDYSKTAQKKDYKELLGTRFLLDDVRVFEVLDKDYMSVNNIGFATGSHEIPAESFPLLQKIADAAVSHRYDYILIEGHTDDTGDDSQNLNLSSQRADAIKSWLAYKGVNPSNIICKGYGRFNPVALNDSETSRRLNRRVEIKFITLKK